ncbi:hypothetical protein K1719_044373 [Acacia pycnantha]|nr:hypothetical protein K1719_044373 [Acacia pycnantha]
MESVSIKDDARPSSADELVSTKKVRDSPDGMDEGSWGVEAPDVVMEEKEEGGGTSYRNKLLNLSDGGCPAKGMELTLVIKLLGDRPPISTFESNSNSRRLKGSFQLIDGKGVFFATFDLEEDYTKVLTGGMDDLGAYRLCGTVDYRLRPKDGQVV